MPQAAGLPFLSDWQNFYTLVGTASATLTGLMFVVITLMAGIERQVSTLDAGVSAFSTPTVVNFCAVLLMAGLLSAPWPTYESIRLLLALLGLGGVLYLLIVKGRMRRVPGYQTPMRDWVWYLSLPLLAYLVLLVAGLMLPAYPALMLYFISAAMAVLLFGGIHNAWDLVTFLAVERAHPEDKGE